MARSAFAALLSALVLLFSSVPAAAQAERGAGYYYNLKFANTTDWCVWFTLWTQPQQRGTGYPFTHATALNVPPHQHIDLNFLKIHAGQAATIRIKTELYAHGNCSGSTVGSITLTKTATVAAPGSTKDLHFNAEAQLDHGNGKFNLYFGADKFLY
jgi:hypothetical protein